VEVGFGMAHNREGQLRPKKYFVAHGQNKPNSVRPDFFKKGTKEKNQKN
jgi:hypothetical protein